MEMRGKERGEGFMEEDGPNEQWVESLRMRKQSSPEEGEVILGGRKESTVIFLPLAAPQISQVQGQSKRLFRQQPCTPPDSVIKVAGSS